MSARHIPEVRPPEEGQRLALTLAEWVRLPGLVQAAWSERPERMSERCHELPPARAREARQRLPSLSWLSGVMP